MNSAHILTRYEPKARATEQPDGTLLLEVDLPTESRFFIAVFSACATICMGFGALLAVAQHMTVAA